MTFVSGGGSAHASLTPPPAAWQWTPEMYELSGRPTKYDAARGGVAAGGDVVRLFSGAAAVLARFLPGGDPRLSSATVAVASSTTEPAYAATCLENLPVSPERGETVADLVDHRQIYPGSKGRQHFPALQRETGVLAGDTSHAALHYPMRGHFAVAYSCSGDDDFTACTR